MMKRHIFLFLAFIAALPAYVSADMFSAWTEDDEEANMLAVAGLKSAPERPAEIAYARPRQMPAQSSLATESGILGSYSTRNSGTYATHSSSQVTVLPSQITSNNNDMYGIVDYDIIQSERAVKDSEIMQSIDKWQLGVKNVYWENYRGNNVRIEMLRNNRDLKEMRLKFVQSQYMISDPDGSISDMLNNVADNVMKSTCGRKARQAIILYERPSVELVKETTYDNYKIIAKGTSLKEYGFRCIY
jgi:hypothetical protein